MGRFRGLEEWLGISGWGWRGLWELVAVRVVGEWGSRESGGMRGVMAGASGSRLRGMAALLPWDDPAPCKWGVRVGVTSRHLSSAVLYCTGLRLDVELFFLLFPFFVISGGSVS